MKNYPDGLSGLDDSLGLHQSTCSLSAGRAAQTTPQQPGEVPREPLPALLQVHSERAASPATAPAPGLPLLRGLSSPSRNPAKTSGITREQTAELTKEEEKARKNPSEAHSHT